MTTFFKKQILLISEKYRLCTIIKEWTICFIPITFLCSGKLNFTFMWPFRTELGKVWPEIIHTGQTIQHLHEQKFCIICCIPFDVNWTKQTNKQTNKQINTLCYISNVKQLAKFCLSGILLNASFILFSMGFTCVTSGHMLAMDLLEPRDWSSGQVPDSMEHIGSMDPVMICEHFIQSNKP